MTKISLTGIALLCFCLSCAAEAEEGGEPGTYYLSAKGTNWALAFDIASFGLEPVENASYNRGTSQRMKTGMGEDGFMVSAFIEPLTAAQAAKIKSSVGCRNLYWEKLKNFPIPAQDTKRMAYRGMALLQNDYEQPREDGVFFQRSVHAYLFHPGYCVDLHVSKSDYQSGDSAELNRFLNKVRLVKNYRAPAGDAGEQAGGANPKPGGSGPKSGGGAPLEESLNAGIMAYMGGDYKAAALNFGRVLESEKKERTLSDRGLIPVIDHLGESYGRLGDFAKAHETLDYGLSLFPTHTPFNYNKACAYGEAGDLDKVLAELEKAYANNPRLKPYLPNPARDSSFAKFRGDQKFKDFLARNGR